MLGIRIVDESVVDRQRLPSHGSDSAVIDQISAVVEALIDRSPQPPRQIGIGIAGFVGLDGIARSAPNTPGLIGVDLPTLIGERHGIPVRVNNDANCVAVAAAHSRDTTGGLLAITVGTGVGGGFMINRKLLRGHHGFAAEPGHMVVDPSGPECPCGNKGCWERFASGTGIAWLAQRAAQSGEADSVLQAAGTIDGITGEIVSTLVKNGDTAATRVFSEFTFYLALGVANLIMLLDPEEVVIGGGVSELRDLLIDPLKQCIAERFPAAVEHRQTRIVIADLGEEAGAWGAALLSEND